MKVRKRRLAALLIVLASVGVIAVVVAVVPGRAATRSAGRSAGSVSRTAGLGPRASAVSTRAVATGGVPTSRQRARSAARAWAALPTTGWIATLERATSWSTQPGAAPVGRLAARNPYGTSMVLALVGAPRSDGWAEVELPVRPNGSTGWILWRSTKLDRTTYRVEVDLDARRLTVLDGTRTLLTTPVAVGTPRTPTPTGATYLWELVRPADPAGAYGPFIFGLAMYSDAYAVFNGGEAQIGIHGSDEPGSIGEAASNGCVRLPNAVVARITGLLPLGTPVTISA